MSFIKNLPITLTEERVLEFLRNKKFSSIKVIKNKGTIDIIEGLEKIRDNKKIIEILNQHSYQNIEIIQSQNKIVHINRTVRLKFN